MKKLLNILWMIIVFFVFSCEKNDDISPKDLNDSASINEFVHGVMHDWYLWNDSLKIMDFSKFANPQDLINAMTINLDKWSFVDKAASVNAFFQEGNDFGYGFFIGWDNLPGGTRTIRVMLSYNNTTAYSQGIRRGWRLLEMNNTPVEQVKSFDPFLNSSPGNMSFKFLTNDGTIRNIQLTKENYKMNGILHSEIRDIGDKKVGYMVYQSFLGYTANDLNSQLKNFEAENIEELIIDLRFNTGGYISIAHNLANSIAPGSALGKTFFEMRHNNSRKAQYDTTYTFGSSESSLNLSRVFFITNEYSASASELIINGLDPHMNVVTIGDNTSGKPVAMYGFDYKEEWLVYPVTAKSINAQGYGEYFGGIPPDKKVDDKFHYDWGNINEPLFSQAVYYIAYGTFKNVSSTQTLKSGSGNKAIGNKLHRNLLLMDL